MSQEISSLQNEKFKKLKSLLSSKGIQEHKQALLFGRKVVAETIKKNRTACVALLSTEKLDADLDMFTLGSKLFETLDVFGTKSPILVVNTPPYLKSENLNREDSYLYLPFQEPSNVGATLRSAAAFGMKNIILSADAANPFHPRSSRSASGTLFHFNFFKIESFASLKGFNIIGLDMQGSPIESYKFPKSFILVPGQEGQGLNNKIEVQEKIKIQMDSGVDSLNASVATSVALYFWKLSRL